MRSDLQALVEVIVPVFLVLGFGYLAAWQGWITEVAIDGVMRFVQTFAVPCLLFKSITHLDLAANFDAGLLLSYFLGAFSCFALGYFGARHLFVRNASDSVSIGFTCLFSNALLLGLPITERAYGSDALTGNIAIISINAPLTYGFGITMMELVRSREQLQNGQILSKLALAKQVLRAISGNAMVLGIIAGFIFNLGGLALPEPVVPALDMMARAALPAALFGLGGVLFRYRPEGDLKTIGMVCCITLLAHPAITWVLGQFVFHLDVAQTRSSVMTASMAPGVNAYLFANMYGAARRVAASTVLLATASSIITVWAWLHILP